MTTEHDDMTLRLDYLKISTICCIICVLAGVSLVCSYSRVCFEHDFYDDNDDDDDDDNNNNNNFL